jgi:hypothetical protein
VEAVVIARHSKVLDNICDVKALLAEDGGVILMDERHEYD